MLKALCAGQFACGLLNAFATDIHQAALGVFMMIWAVVIVLADISIDLWSLCKLR